MAELTEEQLKAYRKRPWTCPFCGSENIEGEAPDIEGNQADQEMYCNDCENVWWDVYERKWVAVPPNKVYDLPPKGE